MVRNKLLRACFESSSKSTTIARATDRLILKRNLSIFVEHSYGLRPDITEADNLTTVTKGRQKKWNAQGITINNVNVATSIHSYAYQKPSLLVSFPLNVRTSSSLGTKPKAKRSFIPRKAPVKLTPPARKFFKILIEQKLKQEDQLKVGGNGDGVDNDKPPSPYIGIMLKYQQSNTGEPRMVYTFDYVTQDQISSQDEPVSLEIIETVSSTNDDNEKDEEEIPKPPEESINDGLPKLYIHQHAFLKVLGSTIDLDMKTFAPILFDKEGNELDPNA